MLALETAATDIRERLSAVVARSSQAEVARRSGTSKNNVSRYLRGAKIPIEFGAGLVEGLGVNPVWLLTGEGTQSLSDVSDHTARTASQLLDLVRSMSSIAKMKLGSLAGKQHAKTLRELNEALDAYERVRATMADHTRSMFSEMIAALERAVANDELAAATELKGALSQMVRLCPDEQLEMRMLKATAWLEFQRLNFSEALSLQRDLCYRLLRKGQRLDGTDLEVVYDFARTLKQCCATQEARGLCQAAIALAGNDARRSVHSVRLHMLLGWLEAETGQLYRGIARAQRAFSQLTGDERLVMYGMYLRPLMLAGMLELQAVRDIRNESIGTAATVLGYACFHEDREALESVYNEAFRDPSRQRFKSSLFGISSSLVLEALKGGRTELDRARRMCIDAGRIAGVPNEAAQANASVLATQLARIQKDRRAEGAWLLKADASLRAMPDGQSLPLIVKVRHIRNVLLFDGTRSSASSYQALVRRARRNQRRLIDRGYLIAKLDNEAVTTSRR